jgi:hypothetical protein
VAEGRVRGAPRQQLPLTPAPSPARGRGEKATRQARTGEYTGAKYEKSRP